MYFPNFMSIQIQATTIIQQKSAMQMTLSCETDSRKILLALEATCVMRNVGIQR